MDIKSGDDFDLLADSNKCWASMIRDGPLLMIGPPSCLIFSRLQELNKHMHQDSKTWLAKSQERTQQAKRYAKIRVNIYNHLRSEGPYLVHEHPWVSTSWNSDCIAILEAQYDVRKVLSHMCQFGMTSRTGGVGSEVGPALEPTGS